MTQPRAHPEVTTLAATRPDLTATTTSGAARDQRLGRSHPHPTGVAGVVVMIWAADGDDARTRTRAGPHATDRRPEFRRARWLAAAERRGDRRRDARRHARETPTGDMHEACPSRCRAGDLRTVGVPSRTGTTSVVVGRHREHRRRRAALNLTNLGIHARPGRRQARRAGDDACEHAADAPHGAR